jgi:hypothetical protein
MKPRAKTNGNPAAKPARPARDQARIVEAMAAKGLSADVIASCLGTDRNTLRGRHALSLHNGRERARKQKAEAGDLTREEMCAADAILTTFASGEFVDPVCGSLLWWGLDDGSGAKTAAEAFAAWVRGGARFITTGVDKSFGPERIAEFLALKIEAKRLLSALGGASGGSMRRRSLLAQAR